MWSQILAVTEGNEVQLALISVIATSVGALVFVIRNGKVAKDTNKVAVDTNNQISEVNAAVNNIGPGEHRLYDKVTHIAGELSFIKENVSHLTTQMEQHRLFWEDFHEKWGSKTHGLSPENEIVVALGQIQSEVGKFSTILEAHIKEDKPKGRR